MPAIRVRGRVMNRRWGKGKGIGRGSGRGRGRGSWMPSGPSVRGEFPQWVYPCLLSIAPPSTWTRVVLRLESGLGLGLEQVFELGLGSGLWLRYE